MTFTIQLFQSYLIHNTKQFVIDIDSSNKGYNTPIRPVSELFARNFLYSEWAKISCQVASVLGMPKALGFQKRNVEETKTFIWRFNAKCMTQVLG
jgi:hypothetical protein